MIPGAGAGREFVFVLGGDSSGVVDAARRADTALKANADATRQVAASQRDARTASERLMAGLEGLAGLAAGGAIGSQLVGSFIALNRAMIDSQINADRLSMQLSASLGAGRAAAEVNYLRQVSNRLGLELNGTAVAYARFASAARGTSLEGQGARQVFEAVSKASVVMGLSADETTGALRALEQMMSKGRVQAEELRGQLGDRMPGALQIAARAMGVTVSRLGEMVERGEVLSNEFLPRFAQQLEQELGGSADEAANLMSAATRRIGNSWELLKQDVAASGVSDFIKGQLNIAADALTNVSEKYRLAREAGMGFTGQTAAAAYAVLEFINPINALSYSAAATEGKLRDATERLADLEAAVQRNPHDVYITKLRNNARELVEELQRAAALMGGGRSAGNQTGAETARLNRYETNARQAEESATRRRDALAKVTAELSGETSQLAKAMKTLEESRAAGDISEDEFESRQRQAQERWGKRAGAGRSAQAGPTLDRLEDEWSRRFEEWRARNEVALDRAEEEAARDEERVRSFMLGQVQRSDERVLAAQQRRSEQIDASIEQFSSSAQQIDASLITGAQARGAALLAIERAQVTSRLALLEAEGEERQRLMEAADAYFAARERQLTEELKPEWRRRAEAWADTTELMRQAYDDIMTGFVDRGKDAFEELLATGKLNTRGLVSFIGAEFAKLAYKRYLAPVITGGLESLLGSIFGGTGGAGVTGGRRAAGGPVQAGAVHGIAEAEPEVFTARNGARYLISGQDGWVNPLAAMQGGVGSRAGGTAVTQINHFNVPSGMSSADYAAALENFAARLKADVAEDLARPGRALNRAAVSAF